MTFPHRATEAQRSEAAHPKKHSFVHNKVDSVPDHTMSSCIFWDEILHTGFCYGDLRKLFPAHSHLSLTVSLGENLINRLVCGSAFKNLSFPCWCVAYLIGIEMLF